MNGYKRGGQEEYKSKGCFFGILISIDLLIFFLVFASLCYSIHECWGPIDEKDTLPKSSEALGYVNVTRKFL